MRLRVEETGHGPVMYIPAKDMRLDLMKKTEHSTYCPFKGTASYWTLDAGGQELGKRDLGLRDAL